MKKEKAKRKAMLEHLEGIRRKAKELEKRYAWELDQVHPNYRISAYNLIHYLALRHENLHDLQQELGEIGISRLGKAESHVMASLDAVISILRNLVSDKKGPDKKAAVSIKQGRKQINSNTNALLGKKLKGSSVRIMVTMPTEAATEKTLVKDILSAGMNNARINCAHDDTEIWKKIIDRIEKSRKKTGRNCKICMDLGGPKLRTGIMMDGPKLVHLQPERDLLGNVVAPAVAILTSFEAPFPDDELLFIPVDKQWLKKVRQGDKIIFKDTRKKTCKLIVKKRMQFGVETECFDSAYLESETELKIERTGLSNPLTTKVADMPPVEQRIILKTGDTLILHKDPRPGEPALYDDDGNILHNAHISCTLPEVFEDVRVGEPIILDDGKIEGCINTVSADEIEVLVTYSKEGGAKLRGDKGINLPNSKLRLKGLTDKDRQDLKFITKYAEIVNFSFVNDAADVMDLYEHIDSLGQRQPGIILKIETQNGYKNLPGILLTAMRRFPIGVMIARGDLAIEGGWVNLAQIQEEIMWLCEAAHVPIVWATQVLETLAKKGRPSRAEITDAAMAQRAECVMLNKGPYIIETIKMLDDIMKSMQNYHQKKAPMLPVLSGDDYLNF
jgi:pyruvate kinase